MTIAYFLMALFGTLCLGLLALVKALEYMDSIEVKK